MKRFISLILAVIMALSTMTVALAANEWTEWTTDSSKSSDKTYECQTKTQVSTRTKETTTKTTTSYTDNYLEGWTRDDSKTSYFVDWKADRYPYDYPQTEYVNFRLVEQKQVPAGTQTYLYRYYSSAYNSFSTWQRDGTYGVDGYWVSSYYPYDIYGTGQALYMSDEIKSIGSDYPCWKGETRTTYKTQYIYQWGELYYVFYFFRYSDWSEWRDGTGTNSETTRVRTLYRYRLKDPNLHTVSYNYTKNGGTSSTAESVTVRKGKSISLKPTAEKKGWTFVGWNTSSKAKTALSSLKMGDSNVTLYAIFKKTVTAKFVDYKGTKRTVRTKTKTIYNAAKAANFTAPTQNTFTGWISRGWAASKSNAAPKAKDFSISSNKTFYGLYGKKVKLSYSAEKGKTTPKTQTGYRTINSSDKSKIKDPVIKLADAIKHKNENYSFKKWAYASTSGPKYSAGTEVIISHDTKMYATWKLSNYYNLGEETYSFHNFDNCYCGIEGGHCFGMSMTSAGYYQGLLKVKELGINSNRKIYTLPDNQTTRKNICLYQRIGGEYIAEAYLTGGSYEMNGYEKSRTNVSSDWNKLVKYVSSGKYNNLGKLVLQYWGYVNDNGYRVFAGHDVDFLYYKKVDGQDRIYVYDPNFPGLETYFYKSSGGTIKQKPYATFDLSIVSMGLISVSKFISAAKKYKAGQCVYAAEGQIEVSGVKGTPLTGRSNGKTIFMYELDENETTAKIKPLVPNAQFMYCDETFTIAEPVKNKRGAKKKNAKIVSPDESGYVNFVLSSHVDNREQYDTE